MPSWSTDRRKRSASPRDMNERNIRRRKHEEKERVDVSKRNDKDGNSFSKLTSSESYGSSKRQKEIHESNTRPRRTIEDDDDNEEKPTRTSRFIGERKAEDCRRNDGRYGDRGSGFDSNRAHYGSQDYDPPLRRIDRYGGSNGGYRGVGGGPGYYRRGGQGRWSDGRGRQGFRNRTIVYRPGEEDKPKMNLFDPSQVPKGRSYFEHEDRLSETNRRFRGRGRGRFRDGRGRGWQNRSDNGGDRQGSVWQHDLYEDMEATGEGSDAAMEQGQ